MAGDASAIKRKIQKWGNLFTEGSAIEGKNKEKLSVRLYTNMPSFGYFLVDSKMYFGPNFDVQGTERTITFEIASESTTGVDIRRIFNTIWTGAEPITNIASY